MDAIGHPKRLTEETIQDGPGSVRFARGFHAGSTRIEPTIDVYNVFNNNAVTSAVTTIGSSLGRPSSIVMGRLLRVGGRITF